MTRPALSLRRRSLMSVCLAAGLAAGVAAADQLITSAPASAEHRPDGNTLEWPALVRIADGLHIATANDNNFLYLALGATTPVMRVSLSGGVVLWLDATGGHKDTFGLQLQGPGRPDPSSTDSVPAGGLRLTSTMSDRIDVLGPAKLARRLVELVPGAATGLGAAVGGEDGTLLFEARIPLRRSADDAIAIGTEAGRTFSLGIATPIKRKGPRQPLEPANLWYDPYQDLRYPYRRQPMPMAPLTNAADRPAPEVKPKAIDIWLSVRLAAAP